MRSLFINMLNYKKIYYYSISLIAFFVLFWGCIDFGSASLSYLFNQGSLEPKESQLDEYYSKKMGQERLGDSLIRIIIAGGVFFFSRKKTEEEEGGE